MRKKNLLMNKVSRERAIGYARHFMLIIVLLSIMTTLLNACGGDPRAQQQTDQSRVELDKALRNAQSIGVPNSYLHTIINQENTLSATHAPLTLFNDKPATDYYNNLATRYEQLKVQVQGTSQVATEHLDQQAQNDIQQVYHTLVSKQHAGLPLDTITQLYQKNQSSMQKAHYPKDFSSISQQTSDANTVLTMMPDTILKLQTLNQVITVMKNGHQDVATLEEQASNNQQAIAQATTPRDLQQVNQAIDKQDQQALARFTQAIPLLTQAKVDQFDKNVQQLRQYGMNADTYQKQLDTERAQMSNVKTIQDYQTFAKRVDGDLAAMSKDLLQGQATTLLKQFHSEVDKWGNAHQFHDKYNGVSYPLDGAYMAKGIGEDLDREINAATTTSDYQQTLTDIQNAQLHLQMLETDANDPTPYTQPHDTDKKLMDYYKLQHSQVIVISFIEEAMRVYQNGKLIRSFLITAGRPELPPVPGLWNPLWRRADITFHSPYPQGSAYWYPDTPIHYAILYHEGGYYLHDSWWRNDYGPGTQFYHIDSSGNVSANYGTHGCVNIPLDQAQWLYNNTDYNTQILMY